MAYYDEELHDDDVAFVDEGEVINRSGKPLHLAQIIMRAWGWTKRPANLAAEHLGDLVGDGPVRIYLSDDEREEQQMKIIQARPEILRSLLLGYARRGKRDVKDAGALLSGLTIAYDIPIRDEGFTADVLRCVASHLGSNLEAVRRHAKFSIVGDSRTIRLDPRDL